MSVTKPARLQWGEAVQDLLQILDVPEARLARAAKLERPVLHRYLRGVRRPPPTKVRGINTAFGAMLEQPNVRDYLNAVACQDEIISPDTRSDDDVSDVLLIVSRNMRDGFVSAFYDLLSAQPPEVRKALSASLVAEFRKRLVRHVTGRLNEETFLDAFLRLTHVHRLDIEHWLSSHSEIEHEKSEERLAFEIQDALKDFVTSIADRMKCESRIMSAVYTHLADQTREFFLEMKAADDRTKIAEDRSERIEYLSAQVDLINKTSGEVKQ